jgi:hypothetical protein
MIKAINSRNADDFERRVNEHLGNNYKIISSGAVSIESSGFSTLEWWAILELQTSFRESD